MRVGLQLIALVFVVLLAGCAMPASVQVDDQEGQSGQGKDRFEVQVDAAGKVTGIKADLGRDKDSVRLKAKSPSGWEVDYAATKASGSEQAATRAALEEAIVRETNQSAREGLQKILDALPGIIP